MGTVPSPHTWVAGSDYTTEPNLRTVSDAAKYSLGSAASDGSFRPFTYLVAQSGQTISNNTWTALAFSAGSESVDRDNSHSTLSNTTWFTAHTAGWHLVSGVFVFAANTTGSRFGAFAVNGTGGGSLTGGVNGSEVGGPVPSTSGTLCHAIPPIAVYLNVGDDLEFYVLQTSGGNLATIASGISASSLTVCWYGN